MLELGQDGRREVVFGHAAGRAGEAAVVSQLVSDSRAPDLIKGALAREHGDVTVLPQPVSFSIGREGGEGRQITR